MTTHPPGQPSGPTGPGRDLTDAELNRHHENIGEPNEVSTPPLPTLGMAVRDLERLIRCCLAVLDRKLDPASLPIGTHGHLADAFLETTGYHLEAAMRDLGHIAALPLPAIGSAVQVSARRVLTPEQREQEREAARGDEVQAYVDVPGDADFYEPGRTYFSAEFPEYDWRFRCDFITAHPEDGERTALGWRYFKGQWEAYAYGEDDWSVERLAVDPATQATRRLPGEEPTPGSAAGTPSAARESTGAVVAPGAGADPDSSPGGGAPVSLSGRGVGPGVIGPGAQIHITGSATVGQAAFAKAVGEALRREGSRRRR